MFLILQVALMFRYSAEGLSDVSPDSLFISMGVDFWAHRFLQFPELARPKTLCMFRISRQRWCSLYSAEVPSAVSSDSLRLYMGVDFWAHRFLQLQESVRPKTLYMLLILKYA